VAKTHPTPSDIFQITSGSVENTKTLGEKIGSLVNNRMVFALVGEFGSGKTSFVQGLAKGLDVPDSIYITSPSFTLINEYPGRFRLFHIDLYRIEALNDLEDIGLYDILEEDSVIAIEWADKLSKAALFDHVSTQFEIFDENSRKIYLTAYGPEATSFLRSLKNI
jgi:tRNA threonylcarbamoyladenosine biosynthesis protein TsaE